MNRKPLVRNFRASALIAFMCLLVAVLSAVPVAADEPLWVELPKDEKGALTGPVKLSTFATLAEKLSPSVVHITVTRRVPGVTSLGGGLFHAFPRTPRFSEGLGSGVIISEKGHILTNNHVVEGATSLVVKLKNEREFSAEVVGVDPLTDLALLRIDTGEKLSPAPLGDSDQLKIGEWVIAIGNPFGLDHSVTAGIVSAKGRKEVSPGSHPRYANFIQTDASINPGNSGGPLISMVGEVIGINTAITSSGQGIGFAIPINMAKQILPQLAEGKVKRGYLGVDIQEVTAFGAKQLKMKEASGALVSVVMPGSEADKGGIEVGDVIVEFDGKSVKKFSDLPWLVATAGIGEDVVVKVFRNGRFKALKVRLAAYPDKNSEVTYKPAPRKFDYVAGIGVAAGVMTSGERTRAGVAKGLGVKVVAVRRNSPAAAAGILAGDIILGVLGPGLVRTPKELHKWCEKIRVGDPVSILVINRGGLQSWLDMVKE